MLTLHREGLAVFYASPVEGVPSSSMLVFYNPDAALNRDLTVAFLAAAGREGMEVLDALAGSGVRGIRIGLESGLEPELHFSEVRKTSCSVIEENLAINGLEGTVHCRRCQAVMAEMNFDYVDLDPFGDAVPYLDSALMSVRHNGLLGVTTTDLSVLSGKHPRTARRRYLASVGRGHCPHELGLRVFLGYVVRMAARLDIAVRPLLAVHHMHYYRAFFRVRKRRSEADSVLRFLGYVGDYGPLWKPPLQDPEVISSVRVMPWFPRGRELGRLLEALRRENFEGRCFEVRRLASELGTSPPPISKLLDALRERGFRAERSPFGPDAFRTDAPEEEVLGAFREVAGGGL
ncbi:MAG: hypothetical protein DRN14_07450 [Thermoplasmata archaeon]|nr:MAG: hypothetical protein DRN14_07450 [Thermoplasmata archaeon]HDJ26851.1 hypothetical protein [Aciduliprofundum sp.]